MHCEETVIVRMRMKTFFLDIFSNASPRYSPPTKALPLQISEGGEVGSEAVRQCTMGHDQVHKPIHINWQYLQSLTLHVSQLLLFNWSFPPHGPIQTAAAAPLTYLRLAAVPKIQAWIRYVYFIFLFCTWWCILGLYDNPTFESV